MHEKQDSILTYIVSMQLDILDHQRDHTKIYYYNKLVLYTQDIDYSL